MSVATEREMAELSYLASLLLEKDYLKEYSVDVKVFSKEDFKKMYLLIEKNEIIEDIDFINKMSDTYRDAFLNIYEYMAEGSYQLIFHYRKQIIGFWKKDQITRVLNKGFNDKSMVLINKIDNTFVEEDIKNLSDLELMYEEEMLKQDTYLKTGYNNLDKSVKFYKGDLTVITGQTSTGKSQFGLNIVNNLSNKQGKKGILFDLEMDNVQILNRMFSMNSLINLNKINERTLNDIENQILKEHKEKIFGLENLSLISKRDLNFNEIKKYSNVKKRKEGLDFIVIDLLDKISIEHDNNIPRHLQLKEIMIDLSNLAKELDIHIFLICQANRASKNQQITSENIAGSSSIEQTASNVLLLERNRTLLEEFENKQEEIAARRKGRVIIDKNRRGLTGTVELNFKLEYSLIEEV